MYTHSVTLTTLDSCLFVSLTSYKHRKDPVAHFVFPNKPTGGVFWSWWMSKCGWSGDLAASSFVLFLTCMVLRQKNTMYRRKVISESNCVGVGKVLVLKSYYSRWQWGGLALENIIPLPKRAPLWRCTRRPACSSSTLPNGVKMKFLPFHVGFHSWLGALQLKCGVAFPLSAAVGVSGYQRQELLSTNVLKY